MENLSTRIVSKIMPTYSYYCDDCNNHFELFFYIKDYIERPKCTNCESLNTNRFYIADVLTQATSIKKADSELKTIGDLANRNRDRMSTDQMNALYQKHNDYKETKEEMPLPAGMSRMKKGPKTIWPT